MEQGFVFIRLEFPTDEGARRTMQNLPYVTAALICKEVLQEKDGTLSAIKIVDRVQAQLVEVKPGAQGLAESRNVALPEKFAVQVQLAGLICIKAGLAREKFSLTIDGVTPSSKVVRLFEFPVDFSQVGEEGGQNVVLNLMLSSEERGVHWFDVRADGQLLSRMPLLIETQPQQTPQG